MIQTLISQKVLQGRNLSDKRLYTSVALAKCRKDIPEETTTVSQRKSQAYEIY